MDAKTRDGAGKTKEDAATRQDRVKKIAADLATPSQSRNEIAAAGLPERVKAEMKRQGFSMRRLSERARLGANTIRNMLQPTTKDTKVSTVVQVADALGLTISYLVAGTGEIQIPEDGDQTYYSVRAVPVCRPDGSRVEGEYVAVPRKHFPEQLEALLQSDKSMIIQGLNSSVPAELAVAPGDVVLWSSAVTPEFGALVVTQQDGAKIVRRMMAADDASGRTVSLVALNAAFGRLSIRRQDVLGAVVGLVRKY
jgi:lambda repressor-like predicted transcriptional regulator